MGWTRPREAGTRLTLPWTGGQGLRQTGYSRVVHSAWVPVVIIDWVAGAARLDACLMVTFLLSAGLLGGGGPLHEDARMSWFY